MIENIRLSMKGIWSHKLRSFLTMLGIIIGIAAIIAIVSTIKGTNKQIQDNLIGDGTNTVTLQFYQNGMQQDYSYNQVPDNLPHYTEKVKKHIMNISGVESVSMYHKMEYSSSMYYKNSDMQSSSIYGIDEDYIWTKGLQVIEGRGISANDIKLSRKVALIDEAAEGNFNGDDPVGKTIDINGEPFTVVGIVSKKTEFEPVINSVDDYNKYATTENGIVYVPDSLWPVLAGYDIPNEFIVKTDSVLNMTDIGQDVEDILNSYISSDSTGNNSMEYKAKDLAGEAAQLQKLSESTNFMLIGIASISLLVGGIGVMNIMLVSVTERTREIGLKKALGAKRKAILSQFITEAAMLSVIGGILGVIAGIILSRIMAAVASVPAAISVPAIVISVLFSMLIGVVFGIVPSIKAADLNPIDALRYE